LIYVRVCLIVLGVVIAGTSVQNGEYLASGYFLHFLPMLTVCAVAFIVLRPRSVKLTQVF
jgi:hypothetical protein